MKDTFLFVLTRTESSEIKQQQLHTDVKEAVKQFREQAKKAKIRVFGGDLFFDAALEDLPEGKEFSAGDFEGNRITLRRCKVEGPKKASTKAPVVSTPSRDCGCGKGFMCDHDLGSASLDEYERTHK